MRIREGSLVISSKWAGMPAASRAARILSSVRCRPPRHRRAEPLRASSRLATSATWQSLHCVSHRDTRLGTAGQNIVCGVYYRPTSGVLRGLVPVRSSSDRPLRNRAPAAAKPAAGETALHSRPMSRLEPKSPSAFTAASVPKAMPCCSRGTSSAAMESSRASSTPTTIPASAKIATRIRDVRAARRQQRRHHDGQHVSGRQHDAAMPHVVAQPAGKVRERRVENVVQQIQANRDAGRSGKSQRRRQRLAGIQNQHGVREIAQAENADGHQESAKWRRAVRADWSQMILPHAVARPMRVRAPASQTAAPPARPAPASTETIAGSCAR